MYGREGLQERFVFDGELQEPVMALETEFLAYMRPVVLDGADADAQLVGNLPARAAFRQQAEHTAFR